MRVFVTGGAGFIGHHTVGALLRRGHEVCVFDNLSMGKRERVPGDATFVLGDVLDPDTLGRALGAFRPETIVHLAARVSIRASAEDFTEDAMQNFIGSCRVLEGAVAAGVRRFILASSMAIYADTPEPVPIGENDSIQPPSPYGICKHAAEMLVHRVGGQSGLETMVLRFFNTYGPGQTLTPYVGVMTIFIHRILAGEPPMVFGDGSQCRDFIYVGDVARACVLAVESRQSGKTVNIGTGRGTTVNQVARMLLERMGSSLQPQYTAPRAEETRNSIADPRLAREILGFEAQATLEAKLDEVIEANRT